MKDSTMRDIASTAKVISDTGREVLEATREEDAAKRHMMIGGSIGGAVGGLPGAIIGIVVGRVGGAAYDGLRRWWDGN